MFDTFNKVLKSLGVRDFDCHSQLERNGEYQGLDLGGGSISIQEAVLLNAIIAVMRPDLILELGTAAGASAVAMGASLKDTGKGHLMTIDLAKTPPHKALAMVEDFELPVTFVCDKNSIDYLRNFIDYTHMKHFGRTNPLGKILVFSDTDIKVRPDEVKLVMENFPKGTIIAIHDTDDAHPHGPMRLSEKLGVPVFKFPSPRGLSVLEIV